MASSKQQFAIIFVALMLCLVGGCYAEEENMPTMKSMSLVVQLDKTEYKIGDTINVKYSLINNSDRPMTILPWGGEYTTNWIELYDANGQKTKPVKIIMLELQITPSKDDFITLTSNESIAFDLIGKIVDGSLRYLGEHEEYVGIFIDFDNSAYLLNNLGEYTIKGRYKTNPSWAESAKNLSIKNIWMGELESKPVKIKITGIK